MKKKILFLISFCCAFSLFAGELVATVTLQCTGGTGNRSGVAYNPQKNIYYSVNAGSGSYPLELFDENGSVLQSITSNFDHRGLWWNSNTNDLEGTGNSSAGIWVQNLNENGLPIDPSSGTKTTLTNSKPNSQSNGDYDATSDEIVYYDDGKVYRYSRVNHTLIESKTIINLPATVSTSDLNNNTIIVTGIGVVAVYDHVKKALYEINKNTGEYLNTIQLEASAPASSSFKMSYANGHIFLFDSVTKAWKGYKHSSIITNIQENNTASIGLKVYPNPFVDYFVISAGNEATYKVIDLTGTIVEQGNISENTQVGQNLATGIYKVVVIDGTIIKSETIIKE